MKGVVLDGRCLRICLSEVPVAHSNQIGHGENTFTLRTARVPSYWAWAPSFFRAGPVGVEDPIQELADFYLAKQVNVRRPGHKKGPDLQIRAMNRVSTKQFGSHWFCRANSRSKLTGMKCCHPPRQTCCDRSPYRKRDRMIRPGSDRPSIPQRTYRRG